jgi:hypothetical protein
LRSIWEAAATAVFQEVSAVGGSAPMVDTELASYLMAIEQAIQQINTHDPLLR